MIFKAFFVYKRRPRHNLSLPHFIRSFRQLLFCTSGISGFCCWAYPELSAQSHPALTLDQDNSYGMSACDSTLMPHNFRCGQCFVAKNFQYFSYLWLYILVGILVGHCFILLQRIMNNRKHYLNKPTAVSLFISFSTGIVILVLSVLKSLWEASKITSFIAPAGWYATPPISTAPS